MSDAVETQPLKPHVSYSALKEWLDCGKRYELSRILGLPERPAWWNVGGHAVHAATQDFDLEMFAELGI